MYIIYVHNIHIDVHNIMYIKNKCTVGSTKHITVNIFILFQKNLMNPD